MSRLDKALIAKLSSIVLKDHRPVSFLDFIPLFELEGVEYHIAYGTLRNKFSVLKKQYKIEVDYRSKQTFYTLKDVRFGKYRNATLKTMTYNHMTVSTQSSVSSESSSSNFIDNMPIDKHALHDIRFRFKVNGIWSTIATNHLELKPNDVSKDIALDPIRISDLVTSIVVHHTDTVSVMVACSSKPIVADMKGIIRLSNALTRIEERLSILLEQIGYMSLLPSSSMSIPDHDSWIVTMWHFGIDSLREYAGKTFEMTWEDAEDNLTRVYTKNQNGYGTIRYERQEYPNKTFEEAVKDILNLRQQPEQKKPEIDECNDEPEDLTRRG